MIKVSICVPVYNAEKYIEYCVRSLFEQTLKELEFIFVDDCSSDHSLEVLETVLNEYPVRAPFVKVLKHDVNLGPGVARETAGRNAIGEFIYFPDSDDWIEPSMMEDLYNKAKSSSSDLVLCQWNLIGEKVESDLFPIRDYSREQWLEMLFRRDAPLSLPRRFFSRELYNKCINYIDVRGLVRFEDYLLVVMLHYYCKKVSYVDKVLYHVILHGDSLTRKNSVAAIESSINVCSQLKNFLINQKLYDNYRLYIQTWYYYSYIGYIMFDLKMWNPERFREAVRSNLFSIQDECMGNSIQEKLVKIQAGLVMHGFNILPFFICWMSSVYMRLKR